MRIVVLPAVCAVVLVPWTVGIATRLPHSTVARHWNTAWAGLDVAIAAGLALTSWLAHRRRRVLPVATATATLMCADAWFDLCTSGSGWPLAWAAATAAPELGLAALCLVIGLRGKPHDPGRPGGIRAAAGPPRRRPPLTDGPRTRC